MEMDPDFALGMLKTISTFLDFFATIKFLKKQLQTLQLLNFWISRQNLIRLQNDLRSIFSDFTTDFVVMWEHNWPFVQRTGVQISLEPNFFFLILIKIFKWKLFFTSLWYSKPLLYYSFFKFFMSSWQYLESKDIWGRRKVM